MTAVRNDRIDLPAGLHERRFLAWIGAVGDDALAGRTAWCAAALAWHLRRRSGTPSLRAAIDVVGGTIRARPVAAPR